MGQKRLILLVEDDPVDALAVKRAMSHVESEERVLHLGDGQEALDYLQDVANELPYLIFLDLNMPRVTGISLLKTIKQNARLCHIPVIVLTTSGDRIDIQESFQSSVAGYMTKPLDYEDFEEKVRAIAAYWKINRLPGERIDTFNAEFGSHLAR